MEGDRTQIFNVFILENVGKITQLKNVENVTRIKNVKNVFCIYGWDVKPYWITAKRRPNGIRHAWAGEENGGPYGP